MWSYCKFWICVCNIIVNVDVLAQLFVLTPSVLSYNVNRYKCTYMVLTVEFGAIHQYVATKAPM